MRVALIFQAPESGWRRHTELYHKDSVQVETICRILKKNGMPVSVWNCLNAYIGNRQYKAQADELAFSFIENSFERNRPGLVPSLFELMDIPYAGSDPYAHMVTSDKKLFQEICCCINLQCPRSLEIRSDTRKEEIKDKIQNYNFSFPLVLKYRYGTMSCGLSIVETVEHLLAESERLLAEEKDSSVLCQEYIPGHEVTVPIIGTGENARVLSVIEYTGPKGEPLRTYDMRWKNELDELIQLIPFKQGSASSQQIRQAVYAAVSKFPSASLDIRAEGHMMMCYIPALPSDYLQSFEDFCSFQQKTGTSIIPGTRFHFPDNDGFVFRINLARYDPICFERSLNRVLTYLSDV